MRELTNEELFLVAGAAAAADVDPSEPPTEVPPIVVHPPSDPPPTIPPSPPVEQPTPITPPSGGNGGNGFVPLAAENRIDNAFIDSVEGGQQLTAYVPTKNGVAIDRSGVTVATGVDLGSQTVESLTALGVDQALVNTLSPYLHLTGQAAMDAIKNSPLNITETQADVLDNVVRTNILNAVVNNYNNSSDYADFYQLPAGEQTAIASVAYQYGPGLATATPNFWTQVTTGHWQDAVTNLNDFGDAYDTRRDKEAALIQQDITNGSVPGGG
ncbi:hypothetical protein JH274_12435 [Xanthomonas campestris pv. incanae]|uniref:pesticin C-terminus-like muramidase n=1 Tax=Xanthomonas campestris TaxID=339 RepID=UPI0023688CA2|nr:pesticin C-terminus-like muramidase [Xanthomonas campestris]WDJ86715.1 hypothetical protein JH279_09145 [Xanthomonas campestris pv. incanae]WDK24164.1 hypothetical protein JH274_12435 [Xanthomonas campestris pv. incanae]